VPARGDVRRSCKRGEVLEVSTIGGGALQRRRQNSVCPYRGADIESTYNASDSSYAWPLPIAIACTRASLIHDARL
jgi:hypothetical protein